MAMLTIISNWPLLSRFIISSSLILLCNTTKAAAAAASLLYYWSTSSIKWLLLFFNEWTWDDSDDAYLWCPRASLLALESQLTIIHYYVSSWWWLSAGQIAATRLLGSIIELWIKCIQSRLFIYSFTTARCCCCCWCVVAFISIARRCVVRFRVDAATRTQRCTHTVTSAHNRSDGLAKVFAYIPPSPSPSLAIGITMSLLPPP